MPVIPVTLLTGFLGSGKTTLLNEMLHTSEFENSALLINEFGDIPLDQDFVAGHEEALLIASSGCICCEARSELSESLNELICRMLTDEIAVPKRLIIETTGLADPAPVIAEVLRIGERPFFQNRKLGEISFNLQSVVTLVGAISGEIDIENHLEAFKQVTLADTILVTKTDLLADPVSRADLNGLKERLQGLNPASRLLDKHQGFSPSMLLERPSYDTMQLNEDATAWLQAEDYTHPSDHEDHVHDRNRHDERVHAINFEFDAPVPRAALETFRRRIPRRLGGNLLRLKGIIDLDDAPNSPAVIHAVRWHMSSLDSLDRWPAGEKRSRLVLIVQDDVDELVGELVADLRNGFVEVDRTRWSGAIAAIGGMTAIAFLLAFLLYTITSQLTGIT